jgi:type IV pilus assembly protein PilM
MGRLSLYHEQPLFGLDIGHSNIKIMQLDTSNGSPKVLGYGFGQYSAQAITNGQIVDYKALAASLHDLFEEHLLGEITTKRVACTVPTARTFSRPMKLPLMNDKDIAEAVRLEAEQYIPVPAANLYIDFDIARRDQQGIDLLMVATPKNIIDSHIKFLEGVGLEPVALEPTMNASARFFDLADPAHDQPAVLIDFGSTAVDLAVFDKTMFVNSTVDGGNDNMTGLISQKLEISSDDAYKLKNQYGIGVSDQQEAIKEALGSILDNLLREVRRIVRYYEEHSGAGQRKISQIVILGGGATMPGLSQYLSTELKLPTRMLDPWSHVDFGRLAAPDDSERPMYATVAGEALLDPRSTLK